MNPKKILFVFAAAATAGILALMVRGFIVGGAKKTPEQTEKAPAEISEILVAATRIEPGKPITPDQVRWQAWPAKIIDQSFIRKAKGQSLAAIVEGTIARAPIVEGEPVTQTKIVKSKSAGILAATLGPGMRALAVPVRIENIAGGFIQANSRVDVIDARQSNGFRIRARGVRQVLASDVRVLAVDQALETKDQKILSSVKTVTLELTPEQVQAVSQIRNEGDLSLALRGLGDDSDEDSDDAAKKKHFAGGGEVTVIRYGRLSRRPAGEGGAQ